MRNIFDPVVCDHRLLVIYLAAQSLDYMNRIYMRINGFEHKQAGILRYFYKSGNTKDKQPIVYLHGIGLGVIFNTKMIFGILEDREAFIIELPWVSQRLSELSPSPLEFVECFEFILTSHGLDRLGVCVIGHSYGSCVAAWICNYNPVLVSSLILIEPVSLMLFHYTI
jgi:pimeloyl-ACP methyl ester carboxylesterase